MNKLTYALVLFALLTLIFSGMQLRKNTSNATQNENVIHLTTEEHVTQPTTDFLQFRWGDTFEEVRDAVEKEHGEVLELNTKWPAKKRLGVKNRLGEAEQQVAVPLENLKWFNVDALGPMVKVRYVFEQKTREEPYRLYYASMQLVGDTSPLQKEQVLNLTREKHGEPQTRKSGRTKIGMESYQYHDYSWETERSIILLQFLQQNELLVDWIYYEK